MRIAFLGSDAFAVPSLEAAVDAYRCVIHPHMRGGASYVSGSLRGISPAGVRRTGA